MPLARLPEPSPDAAARLLRNHLGHRLVLVVGRCEIDYRGRAASHLAPGDRALLFKPDGTFLVHTARGLKPVNWQPPGSAFHAAIEEGRLVLTSHRSKPPETVRVTMLDTLAVEAFDLRDGAALDLEGTEDELAHLIAESPDLVEPGFVPWGMERESRRGPMDLYGEDAKGNRVVVEVKRRAAGVEEVSQLRRYVEKEREARKGTVRGILVAPRISPKAQRFLLEAGLEFVHLDLKAARARAAAMQRAGQASLGRYGA